MEAFGLFLIPIALAVYFLPGLCAGFRGHPQTNAIFVLNIFAGWTFIGWVIAIVWAWMDPKPR